MVRSVLALGSDILKLTHDGNGFYRDMGLVEGYRKRGACVSKYRKFNLNFMAASMRCLLALSSIMYFSPFAS